MPTNEPAPSAWALERARELKGECDSAWGAEVAEWLDGRGQSRAPDPWRYIEPAVARALDAARAEERAAVDALRLVEWKHPGAWGYHCAHCGGLRPEDYDKQQCPGTLRRGHYDDCPVGAALRTRGEENEK